MCTSEELPMKIIKYESEESPRSKDQQYLTLGMCHTYTIMKAMPQYFTADIGCLSLSNNIHNC